MTLEISICMENEAFSADGGGPEIARILRDLAERYDGPITKPEWARNIYDVNGNNVGDARIIPHPLAKYA